MPAKKKPAPYQAVEILKHDAAKRENIPTARVPEIISSSPAPARRPNFSMI
jgi:hypothetical protein